MSPDRAVGAGRAVGRWIGVALTLIVVVGTLWLAATDRLELYVHPRYTVFTVILALVGGALAIGALLVGPDRHDDDAPDARRPGRARALLVARFVLLVAVVGAVLVLPPRSLTAHTAQNRALATSTLSSAPAPALAGASTADFTVKDWATLLRAGDPSAVTGRAVHVSGYVLAGGGGADVFYASRLLVTCCAVDAQPVGIPIHVDGWAARFPAGTWVELSGKFQENPSASSSVPLVVVPESIRRIREPAKPYVY